MIEREQPLEGYWFHTNEEELGFQPGETIEEAAKRILWLYSPEITKDMTAERARYWTFFTNDGYPCEVLFLPQKKRAAIRGNNDSWIWGDSKDGKTIRLDADQEEYSLIDGEWLGNHPTAKIALSDWLKIWP